MAVTFYAMRKQGRYKHDLGLPRFGLDMEEDGWSERGLIPLLGYGTTNSTSLPRTMSHSSAKTWQFLLGHPSSLACASLYYPTCVS